jgi:tetratricopeptide (TPR) repeat protein
MNGIRLCILVLFATACYANDKLPVVRGRVEGDSPFFGSELVVELQNQNRTSIGLQSSVSNDGWFEFRDVPPGVYDLTLTNNQGAMLNQQVVDLHSYATQLSINLPKEKSERPVSGLVSMKELMHPVPPKALRAFVEAEREANSGHPLEAVRKLQRALEVYPNYSDARCNLGVQFIRMQRYPEALEQFQKAVVAGPPSAMLYGNLAYSLAALGRAAEAEQAARHAISLDESYLRGHYLLGDILAKSVTPRLLAKAPEAAQELRISATELPHSYLIIAQLYMAEGDNLSAAEELRLYLKSKDARYRPDVERWLAKLAAR